MAIKSKKTKKRKSSWIDDNIQILSNSDSKTKRKKNKEKTLAEVKKEVSDNILWKDMKWIDKEGINDLLWINTFKDNTIPVIKEDDNGIKISRSWRPTDYDYQILFKKYSEYIKECNDSWQRLVKTRTRWQTFDSDGFDFKLKVKLPSIEGYALYVGFTLETIYVWEKKYRLFSDIIKDLRQRQVEKLLEWGISWKYNPVITRLLLSKHWYVEKVESDVKQTTTIQFARPASPFNQKTQK